VTDDELRGNLQFLGLPAEDWRTVALLPLVAVAWADGRVQTPERARILEAAHDAQLLDGTSGAVIREWLHRRPTEGELELALQVIEALTLRHRGPGADFGAPDLERIVAQCEAVARAAGGLLDLAFTVEAHETALLHDLKQRLSHAAHAGLSDLPSPDTGYTEL
jgi:hypothetical protein